ncbi:MAG TPA: BMP family ABC transporter substrate-binding protein, partial [Candidatus Avilachnospira avicola]|nr:BMP family ABC transporter substrate-binding protein [Candidatus Avilachnospira avicola]
YVDNDYFKEVVPEEVRNEMQEAKEKIASGEIDVKSYYDFTEESEYADFVASAG